MSRANLVKTICLAVFLFSVGGFAQAALAAENQKDLTRRVRQEWDAKLKGDWGKVYDLAVADFKRKVKRSEYLKDPRLPITEYSIIDIKVIQPKRRAKVSVNYKTPYRGLEFEGTAEEDWVMQNGKWALILVSPAEALKKAFPD